MNSQLNALANTIYLEFTPDITQSDQKTQRRWSRSLNLVSDVNPTHVLYQAAGHVWVVGAECIRDDQKFDQFRRQYHELCDLIDSINTQRNKR